ncbi:MAG: hypothetical protein HFE63_03485 [Clostridiales bacterium]|nr:hypothetical protein [Clostridiales bacterium]
MNGKDKCAILKQIRRDIAEKNDISLTISECKHKGDCAGTCPRCESEVRELERALADRKKQGKRVVVAGISAGLVAASCVSCEFPGIGAQGSELQGDMMVNTDDSGYEETTNAQHETYDELMGNIPADNIE